MKKIVLLLCTLLLTLSLSGCAVTGKGDKPLKIVTSFYPMYIDVINITKDVPGIEVVNMTEPQTGCLHDYQLTTADMKTLSTADVFVVNGGGMESFLEKVASENKKLKIVDASNRDDINFLKDGDEINPHVWLSVTYSIAQVKAITSELCQIDPDHADLYRKNALDYVMKLEKLKEEMHAELDGLPHKDIVTFHEAFPYLAKEFGLHIVSVIEREPGTEPTPKELEDTIAQVNSLPVKVLFTEPQYSPTAAKTIAEATGAKLYELDPVVTGEATPEAADAYINDMKKNMEVLKEALQ